MHLTDTDLITLERHCDPHSMALEQNTKNFLRTLCIEESANSFEYIDGVEAGLKAFLQMQGHDAAERHSAGRAARRIIAKAIAK